MLQGGLGAPEQIDFPSLFPPGSPCPATNQNNRSCESGNAGGSNKLKKTGS